jgi:RNA polymerase sigma factor (sigma-70 family)
MQELDDSTLLRDYAERASEAAFATLVARHINKVYSVALRHTRNPAQAEEITQAVFVILAKKSRRLRSGVILSGWLYHTARLTAVTFLRSEIRRARREQEAYMQTALNENEPDLWPQIAPLLDAGMAALNEKDRHAVVLRFFDGKSMSEVGATLGANEDAAKKRVGRALGKLRNFFTKRGVSSTTAAIGGAISTNSIQAAPVALANSVTTLAIAKGAAASASTLTLIQGALKVMAWSKAKTGIVLGISLLLAAGTAFIGVKLMSHHQQPDSITLQGTWKGREMGTGPAGVSSLILQGTNLEFHGADPREWYKATFTVRDDTTPKQLLIVITDCPAPAFVGKTSHSIYEIHDGTFTITGNAPGDPRVPASFDAPGARKLVFTKK